MQKPRRTLRRPRYIMLTLSPHMRSWILEGHKPPCGLEAIVVSNNVPKKPTESHVARPQSHDKKTWELAVPVEVHHRIQDG